MPVDCSVGLSVAAPGEIIVYGVALNFSTAPFNILVAQSVMRVLPTLHPLPHTCFSCYFSGISLSGHCLTSASSFRRCGLGAYGVPHEGPMSNAIYTKPWMRASPYLIGMLAGMAWVRYKPSLCALADRATRLTALRCTIRIW